MAIVTVGIDLLKSGFSAKVWMLQNKVALVQTAE